MFPLLSSFSFFNFPILTLLAYIAKNSANNTQPITIRISAILKFSRSGTLISGGEQLQLFKPNNFSGKTLGKIKIWSPNGLNNPNSGGTLFKIGKTFRLDFEAGKQLFHTHITYNLYNSMPNFMKSTKWIFDPAKRDVHVRLTSILGGVIGVTQKE